MLAKSHKPFARLFASLGMKRFHAICRNVRGGCPEWHILGDALDVMNGNCLVKTESGEEFFVMGKWDLIIAHPTCTYLSNAGACRLYKRIDGIQYILAERLKKGFEAKEFFLKFLDADCPRICVENPMPSSIFGMPKQTQIIQPYEYGEPYTKRTYLWLKGLKPLKPTEVVKPIAPYCPSGTGRKIREKYGAAKRGEDAKNRAKFFEGWAKAMAEQWGG